MSKIKINISRECVKKLEPVVTDFAGCATKEEGAELERIADDLLGANERRDEHGRLEITRETLDWVLGELDWSYCDKN